MDPYSKFVSRWPWSVCVIVIGIMIVCGSLVFWLEGLPDFSEPTAGFETRKTQLISNFFSWQNLANSYEHGLWTLNTSDSFSGTWESVEKRRKRRGLRMESAGMEYAKPGKTRMRMKRAVDDTCYAMFQQGEWRMFYVVYESSSSDPNLFTALAMKSMCEMSNTLLMTSNYVTQPCNGLQIGEVVAAMEGTSCTQLTDDDVTSALTTLQFCAPYYFNGEGLDCLENQQCSGIPAACLLENGAPLVILHYLADSEFLDPATNSTTMTYARQGVFLEYYIKLDFYLENLESAQLDDGSVRISGIDSEFKFQLFDRYLVADMALFILAMVLILVIMVVYLRSFAMTIATIFDVLFSFLLAYFVYFIIFRFPYFPFMNLLTGLILIAIAADDVFIFVDTFQQMKAEHSTENVPFWLSKTMKHAALSILVTSLTTAVAFFANFVSEITAVKCFGVFSGTAILCNFIMMITWVPAFTICVEWFDTNFCQKMTCCPCYEKLIEKLHNFAYTIFGKALPFAIEKIWFLWLLLCLALGIAGIITVFVTPRLKLPSSEEFQVFKSDHPISMFDNELQYKFRSRQLEDATSSEAGLKIQILWGVEGVDNGNQLDPSDHGFLSLDHTYDLSKESSQTFLLTFCSRLHNASFAGSNLDDCAINIFNDMMTSGCVNGDICCGYGAPPFPPDVFRSCYLDFQQLYPDAGLGISYYGDEGVSRAYKIEVPTTQKWTAKYDEMEVIYQSIAAFMEEAMQDAPAGMENAFFSGFFGFYDLQRALSQGTYVAIGLSLGFALIVMLLTSLNVLITIYSLITIAFSIFVTVGILVLLGWELNILESVTISLAVGLSIDFAIHYGVAYRLSPAEMPVERMRESFRRVGGPVTMAAVTTFLAGAAIMPTRVLAYSQLGTFLMLVMVVSWVYATFFFQSLCRIIGPRGNFAQIPSPTSCFNKTGSKVQSSPNVNADRNTNGEIPTTAKEVQNNPGPPAFTNVAFVSCESL